MVDELRCPGCGAAVPVAVGQRPTAFPFCSARCRLIDLGRWADGSYAVADGVPAFADEGDADDAAR